MNNKKDSPVPGKKAKLWILFSVLIIGLIGGIFLLISIMNANGGGGESEPLNGDGAQQEWGQSKGGVILPSPGSCVRRKSVQVYLEIKEPLKSLSKNYDIPSDIYYTTDGTEPSKEKGEKYISGVPIVLDRVGKNTIKARVFSKIGQYRGEILLEQLYTIKPDIEPTTTNSTNTASIPPHTLESTPTAAEINQLDQPSREQIKRKLERIVIEIPGIESIKKDEGSLVNIQLSISDNGDVNVTGISGFTVAPVDKLNEIRVNLYEKFRKIKFSPPLTMNGKTVSLKVWFKFNKIWKFYDKIVIENLSMDF